MDPLGNALRAASGAAAPGAAAPTSPALLPLEHALVLGAGGRLGSALLAEALAAGRFASVQAWVAAPAVASFMSTMRGLTALPEARLAAPGPLQASIAFIVFERERFSNGRDEAFAMPQPQALPALARRLREGGVQRLVVALPHASSMLPQALTAGLATHDEAAVAALGFEHLVLLKPSQDIAAARAGGWLERFAQWWLSQLRWMIPQREQPLRAVVLARLAVTLARGLARAAGGTYVVPQSLLWQLARDADGGEARWHAWLAGRGPAARAAPG
ncbi:MAG: hypothetical protein HZC37_12935 [Burkholderiales bacterium]|nr:hypothetical protein [Burkholderiales bacterium]